MKLNDVKDMYAWINADINLEEILSDIHHSFDEREIFINYSFFYPETRIPNTKIDSTRCDICKRFIVMIETYFGDKKTLTEITELIGQICTNVQKQAKTIYNMDAQQYIPTIISLMKRLLR